MSCKVIISNESIKGMYLKRRMTTLYINAPLHGGCTCGGNVVLESKSKYISIKTDFGERFLIL